MKEIKYKAQKHLIGSIANKAEKMTFLLILMLSWNMILFVILKRWKGILRKGLLILFPKIKKMMKLFLKTFFGAAEEADTEMEDTIENIELQMDN